VVARADGEVVRVEISGECAGAVLAAAARSIEDLGEDLRRLEQRLARPGLTPEERSRLADEAQQLRGSIRATQAERRDQRESLASTPMMFDYASREPTPSAGYPPFGASTERAFGNFVHGIAILFAILMTLLPWAIVALLGWWIARIARRRLGRVAALEGGTALNPA
jgi:hypothetical protein